MSDGTKGDIKPTSGYTLFYGSGCVTLIITFAHTFFVHEIIISAVMCVLPVEVL